MLLSDVICLFFCVIILIIKRRDKLFTLFVILLFPLFTFLLFFLKRFVYLVCDFVYNATFLSSLYPYILLHCE